MLIDPKELVDRYVAVWNQPDAERRRKAITQLWTEDGVQHLQPPQEVREAATRLGLTPTLEARGHDELGVRVTRSYEEFIASGEFVFRRGTTPTALATSSSSTGNGAHQRW